MYKWVHVFTRDIDLPHVYKNCNYIGFLWALHNLTVVIVRTQKGTPCAYSETFVLLGREYYSRIMAIYRRRILWNSNNVLELFQYLI